ncbi:MAG: type III-B CRISPR module-associated protein Cmr3 [Fimbriimonadales bacterium]|nr:type III-B CRISPR module-associated protein Cmr3 [Fimbriimonadales bacterium]
MSWKTVRIYPIDSMLFRDGRPFGMELGAQAAVSMPIPTPSTTAGFLRTLIGNLKGVDWEAVRNGYSEECVKGPLLQLNEQYVFPAPADAVVFRQKRGQQPCSQSHEASSEGEAQATPAEEPIEVVPLRPYILKGGQGCCMPHYDCGLQPLMLTSPNRDKPVSGYDFWDWDALRGWLLDKPPGKLHKISSPPAERRVHVAINEATLTSEESLLYTVEYRSYELHDMKQQRAYCWSILAQVSTDLSRVQGAGGLGGERRLAYVEQLDNSAWLTCPDELKNALKGTKRVRMYLATPALFTCGWEPGWLKKEQRNGNCALIGSPPCAPEVELKLVAAAVPRRLAVSGWSLKKVGPKPVKWCAPAGSVYFFEVVEGDPGVLAEKCWLESVSDGKEQNGRAENGDRAREAGFGLALWGVWNCDEGG